MNDISGRLSERMLCIAKMAGRCRCLADIGADHGFVSMYLCAEGLAEKAILTDIIQGPLEKAEESVRTYFPEGLGRMEFRLGSGLKPLGEGEADLIVIAGMGGRTIAKIIEESPDKVRSAKKLILQPRTNAEYLRKYLVKAGLYITEEKLVEEKRHIVQILAIRAKIDGDEKYERFERLIDYSVPPLLFASGDPLLKDYTELLIRRALVVTNNLKNGKDKEETEDKLSEWETRLEELKRLRSLCE